MKLGTHMPDVRGGSLLILRFVGQRSRSQLLKIEQKLDTFFVVHPYVRNSAKVRY